MHGTGLGWKAWQLPAGWLPRFPWGGRRGKRPPCAVLEGECAAPGPPGCLARMWDAESRASSGTLAQILYFPGKVQREPSATVPGWESLSLSMQVHLVSIYSKPKSSK